MEENDNFKSYKLENIISVSCQHNKAIKKEVLRKLNECLYKWDPNVKGLLVRYSNLKLLRKLVEIIEEQDYLNIPLKYDAVYFIPKEGQKLVSEVAEISEKCMKVEIFGLLYGYIDLDTISGNLNIHYSESQGNSVTVLNKGKNEHIKVGDLVEVTIVKHYVKVNKNVVLACVLDLNNLIIFSH